MPNEIREEYEFLEQEVGWLHVKWQFYLQLFGTDEKRVELLNDVAPIFFRVCQDVMLDDLIISFSRLTDDPKTGDRSTRRESFSLLRLVNSVDPAHYPDLRPKVQNCWKQVINVCQPIRTQAARRVRHNDWATLKSTTDLLPGINRSMIEDALKYISELMNAILEYFDKITHSYELVRPAGIDGEVLIYHLEKLQKYYERYGDVDSEVTY